MTDYENALDVMFSTIREKHALPEGLAKQWFRMAVASYELDISALEYNENTQMFGRPSNIAANVVGLIMSLYYIKRERSRINKLQNIVGRDISFNSTGDSKRAVRDEYADIYYEVESRLHKLKTHAFN